MQGYGISDEGLYSRFIFFEYENDWIPLRYWPRDLQYLIMNVKHWKNVPRMRLLQYWMANGASPEQCLEWISYGGPYDKKAIDQIGYVIREEPNRRYPVYNFALGRQY